MSAALASDRRPALAASLVLHVGVFALALVTLPGTKDLRIGSAVPVNIVPNAPTTDLRAAMQSDTPESAQTEEPAPETPVEAVAPTPAPAPPAVAVAKPAPPPKPALKPAAKPAPAKPEKPSLDLDALEASLAKTPRGGGRPATAGAKGPPRAETAPLARPAAGTGLSASALSGLAEELQRRWNPNCEVEGGRDVKVRAIFVIGPAGQVVGGVDVGGQDRSPNPVVQAAAERAIRAVYQAAPFRNLPRDLLGSRIAVNFNAREACS